MANSVVSPAGMRLVKLLVGKPPMTIAQLMEATGVTRTAVTEQLGELVAGRYVERTLERLPGRGRPHHLYTATNASLLLLCAGAQHLVMPAVWKALEETGGTELTQRIIAKVADELAEHYRERIRETCPKNRLKEMASLLRSEGTLVDVIDNGGSVALRKRSCPFIGMLDKNRSICCIDERMLSSVIGHPLYRATYRQEGDPCCTFQLRNGQR